MLSTSARSDRSDPPGTIRVWHYDGVNGLRRAPVLVVDGDRFTLAENGASDGPYAFADLLARDAVAGETVFGLKGRTGWRIGFPEGVPDVLKPLLPKPTRYGGFIDRIGLWPAAAGSAVIAAIVVVIVLNSPSVLARAVPPSVERQLGDLMTGDFGDRSCAGPNGPQALSALVERVDPGDGDIDVRVVNLPVVNAVTLPGGHIVLFDGLIRKAVSPDEVAGVLAHEIGHVKHRDVMESLLRQLGLSVLLGGLDGHVGGYTNALLASAYSRDAEARADDYAMTAMQKAAVTPLPTAQFFTRLSKGEDAKGVGRLTAYFASHPMSHDRAAKFLASAKTHKGDRPALDADQWASLKGICKTDPEAQKKPSFRF
ncbi:M48 family metallopeptidase [Sphingomonas immobilis]|uniref:M48 family metallopeptidase n=1 Tax=Sphingomonas immobilis TaxID=3063997 RepID=A0ABT9A3V4_9SPHN|nr:M48 family metallopeptidase [Sphingomonas sp. CA1-15]MDO7844495.1 M48 family metallopeptidase [Sphingomonas sp. CA1-15]